MMLIFCMCQNICRSWTQTPKYFLTTMFKFFYLFWFFWNEKENILKIDPTVLKNLSFVSSSGVSEIELKREMTKRDEEIEELKRQNNVLNERVVILNERVVILNEEMKNLKREKDEEISLLSKKLDDLAFSCFFKYLFILK